MINMDKEKYMTDQTQINFPIHAYLSYRCKELRDIRERENLETLCTEQGITLRYDQNETEEGDSLTEFMQELTSARCIFLFLSPEYFQSAYTLFELVRISEWADLDRRFILPIRLSEAMVTYQWTHSKNYFDSHEAIANELARLLKMDNVDQNKIWQRIDDAWQQCVFPYLDKLNVSLESNQAGDKLLQLLKDSREQVNSVFSESIQNLHDTVEQKIQGILKNQHIPLVRLAEVLQLDSAATLEDIVKTGLLKNSVSAVLDSLYKLSRQLENQANSSLAVSWDQYLFDIEQLCGWLLLSSVDPVWWFHNQLSLQQRSSEGMTGVFKLQQPAYVEVLISRSLLQRAQYCLDEYGDIRPVSKEYDVLLFDAISPEATDSQLLSPIYKDLRPGSKAPQDIQRLLDGIVLTAKSLHGARDGKPIYYMVTESYLNMLKEKDWFTKTEQKLKGYLQFICCIRDSTDQAKQACREEQDLLLEKVANILRLNNKKGSTND